MIDRRSVIQGVAAVAAALGLPPAFGSADPVGLIPFTPNAGPIDASFGERFWSRSLRIAGLVSKEGQSASRPTVVSLLHDGVDLRVGFDCRINRGETIRVDAKSERDVWADDWVALAVDPRGLGFSSYFFLLNANGVSAEGALDVTGRPRQVRFTPWKSVARRTNVGWSAEFAIPLSRLAFRDAPEPVLAARALRYVAQEKGEAGLPDATIGVPDTPQYRAFKLAEPVGIRTSAAPYAQDLEIEFEHKLSAIAQRGDATLDTRVAAFGDASVLDYKLFPPSPLESRGSRPRQPDGVRKNPVSTAFAGLEYAPGRRIGDIQQVLTETQGSSLIVMRDGALMAEWYANGFRRDSVFTSFSVAKSFVSTLVGIAIDKGVIQSEDESVTRYVPELLGRDERFGAITLAHLMHMASGLAYEESGGAHDDQRTYMDPDLRRAALEHTRISNPPNKDWLYNNYNPLLIGLALERATRKSVTALTQEWLWTPLRMAFPASWSLDSRACRFEKMESGLNAHPLDFARLGTLFLDDGVAHGERIVSERWIRLATQPLDERDAARRIGNDFYGLFWWIERRESGLSDYYALGNKGQCIYCAPRKRLVVVKTGIQHGLKPQGWPALFRGLADAL